MSGVRRIIFLASLVAFATGFAEAEAQVDGEAAQVAGNLVSVASCSDPMRNETYRVVVFTQGFEHVSSMVYLQWLAWDEDGPRMLKNTPVAELSSGMWSVGSLSVIPGKGCSIQLDATHTYSAESERFVVRPVSLGHYSIRNSNGVHHDQ